MVTFAPGPPAPPAGPHSPPARARAGVGAAGRPVPPGPPADATAPQPAAGAGAPPPGPDEGEEAAPREVVGPKHRSDSVAGWAVSLILHSLILVGFSGYTWMAGLGTGGGRAEADMGVVIDTGGEISSGAAEALQMQADVGEVALTGLSQEPAGIEPITGLGPGVSASSPIGPLVASALCGGGGGPAARGDLSMIAGGGVGGGASFFGIVTPADASKFVYVLDYSGSMQGKKLALVKEELLRAISALKQRMKFYIIFYDDDYEAMAAEKLVPATQQNKRQYLTWANGVHGGGGTDPTEAMKLALSLKPHAIWLLSDGIFNPHACDVIRRANPRARVRIHTIAFWDNAGQSLLERIAKENRGRCRFVPGPGSAPPGARPAGRRHPRRTIRRP